VGFATDNSPVVPLVAMRAPNYFHTYKTSVSKQINQCRSQAGVQLSSSSSYKQLIAQSRLIPGSKHCIAFAE
jgi:hypothetical protein